MFIITLKDVLAQYKLPTSGLRLTTGCVGLDRLFGEGEDLGFEMSAAIHELAGEPGSGKTQIWSVRRNFMPNACATHFMPNACAMRQMHVEVTWSRQHASTEDTQH